MAGFAFLFDKIVKGVFVVIKTKSQFLDLWRKK